MKLPSTIFAGMLLSALTGLALASPKPQPASREHGKSGIDKTIAAILADPSVAGSHWGISVVTPSGNPIYSLNDTQSFEPASNAKLFTTATAFAVFSPDAHFETKVVASGTLTAEGTLSGDIVIEGSGDPSISGRAWPYAGKTERLEPPLHALEDLADQIAKGGLVRKLTGRVIGDDTWLPFERYGAGWGWDDLQWDYGAPVSALTINDNVVYLDLMPGGKAGDPIAVAWNPPVPYYALDNHALTGPSAPKAQFGVDREPGSKIVRLFGTIPVDSKGIHVALAIEDPAEFTALAFREMLTARGIAVAGAAEARHRRSTSTAEFLEESKLKLPTPLPIAAPIVSPALSPMDKLLATHSSPPLAQDLTVINKVSQNLHAELLLRDLGKAVLNDGSVAAGARVVRQFLIQAGVSPGDFVFFDGSGLSPQDLITPRAATTLLAYASRQPWGEAFRATLPIAGVDGTLAGRLTHSPVKTRLAAKTGTLAEVGALSGYLTTRSGKTVILSILCNGHDPAGDATRKATDKIVEAIDAAN